MTGVSPSRPTRRRTDFADFFRGSSSHEPGLPRQSPKKEAQAGSSDSTNILVVPQSQTSTTLKKVATKIPFLGRNRKKSTSSVKSGYMSSDVPRGYESSDVGGHDPARKKNWRLSQPVSSPEPASVHPPLPKAALPQPRPSLSLKFAAHLSHKSRKHPSSPRPMPAKHVDGSVSDTVAVPRSRRRPSMESDSSTTSGHGRSTPRAGPTITVSLSPDGLDDYKDLFTRPRQKGAPAKRISSTPASEYRDLHHDGSSNATLTPGPSIKSPPKSSPLETMTEIARREARQLAAGHVSNPLSKSVKRVTASNPPETDDSATEAESVGSAATSDGPSPTFGTFSSLPKPSRSCRMRSPSATGKERTQPPSIPLPLPPPPTSRPPVPPSPQPVVQPSIPPIASTSMSQNWGLRRPRANTIGSIPSAISRVGLSPLQEPPSQPSADEHSPVTVTRSSDNENLDVDRMTVEQLKQALRTRNDQYEELAIHFLEVTKLHTTEKIALEKKIRTLETEALRRDKEIQGFTWMVNNRGPSSGARAGPLFLPSNNGSRPALSSKLSSRILHSSNPDDSGAESYQTSGAESMLGSGASESSLSMHKEKVRRPRVLGDSNYFPLGTSGYSGSESPGLPDLPNGKRSSFYSITSSASSSTSSLLPPLNTNLPVSSLSAIPESATTPTNNAHSFSSEQEGENRLNMASSSHQISMTSSASTTSVASSAYSANLKRGRPPSIAQVLDKSTKLDDALKVQP